MKYLPATGPDHPREVRRLFEEYAALLPFNLGFQNFRNAETFEAHWPTERDPIVTPKGILHFFHAGQGRTSGGVSARAVIATVPPRLEPTMTSGVWVSMAASDG